MTQLAPLCQGQPIFLDLTSINKIASLADTLVRKYHQPTMSMTGLKCRATSVAKKIKEKLSQMVFLIERYLRRCTSTSILFHFHPSDMTSFNTWCLKVSHERGAPSRQWVSNQCSLFTYYVSDSPKDKFQNRLFVEQDLRNPSENTKSVTQKLRGRIGARLNAAFIATPTTKQEVMSFLYFEHLLKRYT